MVFIIEDHILYIAHTAGCQRAPRREGPRKNRINHFENCRSNVTHVANPEDVLDHPAARSSYFGTLFRLKQINQRADTLTRHKDVVGRCRLVNPFNKVVKDR